MSNRSLDSPPLGTRMASTLIELASSVSRRRRRAGAALALGLVATACPHHEEETALVSPPESQQVSKEPSATEIDELMALGYIDATPYSVDPEDVGVVHMDRERVQDGFRLYCTRGGAFAELIDIDGNAIRTWRDDGALRWEACALLPNGDLVVIGVDRPDDPGAQPVDRDRHIRRLDWEGREIWRRNLKAHHDIFLLPDGDLLTLTLRYERRPELHRASLIRDDLVVRLTADGSLRGQRSLLEAFRSNPAEVTIEVGKARFKWGVTQVDLIHANTIEALQWSHLVGRNRIYDLGNIIVTSRHQNVVAIIDWETNQLLWAWGQNELSGPHEGRVLASGNILIFDNGVAERRSRVIEVDPLKREIVWEYKAPTPGDFFTSGRGGAERLENGNTLITESSRGRVFEVTRAGEVVWEFLNPHLTPTHRRLTFRRMRHYPRDMVQRILKERAGKTGAGP